MVSHLNTFLGKDPLKNKDTKEMDSKELLRKRYKEMLRVSCNAQASLYTERRSMQSGNLGRLLEYLSNSGVELSDGKYLDAGCGPGTLAREIEKKYGDMKVIYCGIDLAEGMVRQAKKLNPSLNNFIVADIEHLPFKEKSFDGVISNSALHWLNFPEIDQRPDKALEEILRVLKVNRPLAISVSGYGTAKKEFQKSYKKVMAYFENYPEFERDLYREDPIGSMHLADLMDIMTRVGFRIKKKRIDYEPLEYKCSTDYVSDVEAYGYGAYLAPVPRPEKEVAWENIKKDFTNRIGNKQYQHDQYMIYIVALRD